MISRVIAAVLAIGVGCLSFIYPGPNSWSPYVGGFLIFAGLAMLAIAFLARFRPGLYATQSPKEKGPGIAARPHCAEYGFAGVR